MAAYRSLSNPWRRTRGQPQHWGCAPPLRFGARPASLRPLVEHRPVSWDGRFAGLTHVPFPGRLHLPRLILEGLRRQHFS